MSDLTREEIEIVEVHRKISDIHRVLNPKGRMSGGRSKDKIDIDELRKLCVSKHGLVTDDFRRQAWPLLLNLDHFYENEQLQESLNSTTTSFKSSKSTRPPK